MTISLNSLSDKLLISISLGCFLGILFCSFVWDILLSLLILFDFRFLFLWIRQNCSFSWSWRIGFMWECPLCRLLVLVALTGRLELEWALAGCSLWVVWFLRVAGGGAGWAGGSPWGALCLCPPWQECCGWRGHGLLVVLRVLEQWFLLVPPAWERTPVVSCLFDRSSSVSKWISFLYSPAF